MILILIALLLIMMVVAALTDGSGHVDKPPKY